MDFQGFFFFFPLPPFLSPFAIEVAFNKTHRPRASVRMFSAVQWAEDCSVQSPSQPLQTMRGWQQGRGGF